MTIQTLSRRALARPARAHGVTAVLGPTNTGKTHYAIERMLAHATGAIGLPLRLLAREVYGRVVDKAGPDAVALITGEEKIKPPAPRYWVSTVEAMPRDLDVAFVAIDEIQLAADLDRGHVFTDRLLNRRGRDETLLIGAGAMRDIVGRLIPGVHVVERPRLSALEFAGDRKLTRLPRRSAIVAFSAEDVYAIAELIRRQRGGAAVVLGALSPRTRNAQVELYQNGEVDYLVATDAIGMGLNLDVDHVAFAADRKFDGWQHRRLNPAEMGQIAGRAGRNQRDGTFGTTGRCPPFEEELVERLQEHRFDPVPILQWRNSDLDVASIEALQHSLERLPREDGLTRAPLAEDVMVLDIAAHDERVRRQTKTAADVARLWDCCQIPDYRKTSPAAHAELALSVYAHVVRAGRIPEDWFSAQLFGSDRVDGDIDMLSRRIAQVRTCTYIANRPDWLGDPAHWQAVARLVEDRLSDALHERLAQRFIDRRTSLLMRRLRENAMLDAQINAGGEVIVEGQHVGQLHGFRFTPDPQASGEAARALNAAAQKALAGEIDARAERVHQAVDDAFALANDGAIRWLGEIVGKIAAGDKLLEPRAQVLADEQLSGAALDKVQTRLDLWLKQLVARRLGPLQELEKGEGLEGVARGVAYQLAESLGVLDRGRVAEDVRALDQNARAALRKQGVRFGAYHLYLPALLKPAPRALAAQLWALKHGGVEQMRGFDDVPHMASSGRTSFAVADKDPPKGLYRAAGFRVGGGRAVRVDILERLADLIRPAIAYRPGVTPGTPPPGAAEGDGFVVTVAMTSLAGCSGEDFAAILRSLGYVSESRPGPAITTPLLPAAPTTPLAAPRADAAAAAGDAAAAPESPEATGAPEAPEATQAAAAAAHGPTATAESSAPDAPAPGAPDAPVEAAAPIAQVQEAPAAHEASAAHEAPAADAPSDAPGQEGASRDATSPDASSPEASADSAAAAPEGESGAAGDAPAAAPAMIEVWRPHRHGHGRRPEQRGPRRGGRRPTEAAVADGAAPQGERRHDRPPRRADRPQGDRQRERPQGERSQGERPQGERPQGERPQGERPQGERPQGERPQGERPQGDRPWRDRQQGDRRQGRGPRPDAPAGQAAPEGAGRPDRPPRRDGRPDRGPRREGRGDRPSFHSTETPRRDREPDPDSPFAKLAALKARLEGREGS